MKSVFSTEDARRDALTKLQTHLYDERGDIRCGNWRTFDPTRWFNWNPNETEAHIQGSKKLTPHGTSFISISTSPRRTHNLLRNFDRRMVDKIAVIDLRVLRRLGIPLKSTEHMVASWSTEHYYLVQGWVPA